VDNVEKLINDIRNDRRVSTTRFSNRFVNTIGEMYERSGYGATHLFLQEKVQDRRMRFEAQSVLKVLDLVKSANVSLSIGGYIIRKLPLILNYGEMGKNAGY
jgi:hypothetical protein